MTIQLAHPGCSILAVDQRNSKIIGDRVVQYDDCGGRLLRLGDGWGAAIGSTLWGLHALNAMVRIGSTDERLLCSELAAIARDVVPNLAAQYPTIDCRMDDRSTVVTLQDGVLTSLFWDGRLHHRCPRDHGLGISYPYLLPVAQRLRRERHLADDLFPPAGPLPRPLDCLRRVALEFAEVAAVVQSVSPTIELALGDKYIVGCAAEIASSDDAGLTSQMADPPEPHLAAFTRILEVPIPC